MFGDQMSSKQFPFSAFSLRVCRLDYWIPVGDATVDAWLVRLPSYSDLPPARQMCLALARRVCQTQNAPSARVFVFCFVVVVFFLFNLDAVM